MAGETTRRRGFGPRRTRRSGFALVSTYFVVLVGAGLITVTVAAAELGHRRAEGRRHEVQAQYLAAGAVEVAKKRLQVAVANGDAIPSQGTAVVGDVPVDYKIRSIGPSRTHSDAAGMQSVVGEYELDASVSVHRVQAKVHRPVNLVARPIFQYAVFYDGDLEIHPFADMTIRGRVHTNRDIYLASNAALTFDTNELHAAGNIYRSHRDAEIPASGSVRIRNWVANPFGATEPVQYTAMKNREEMDWAGVTTASGYDSRFTEGYDRDRDGRYTETDDWLPFAAGALAYWAQPDGYSTRGSTVMTQEHGITEAVTPRIDATAMFEPHADGDYAWDAARERHVKVPPGTGSFVRGPYHARADLSILAFTNGTWEARDAAGNEVTGAVARAVSLASMYDARQANGSGERIQVLQIDLLTLGRLGMFPENGLLYAANYGEGAGLDARGVRLADGGVLAGKLTVATPDPLYIWGDFNTAYTKPAAVICDALNLLSSAWDGFKTPKDLPPAESTAYHVAVVAGDAADGAGGGLVNLARFHEDWSGKTCTIRGSIAKLGASRYAREPWKYGGDRYEAPILDLGYDTAFNDAAKLPPFTPMAVTARELASL